MPEVEIYIIPTCGKNQGVPQLDRKINLDVIPEIDSDFLIQTPKSKRIYKVIAIRGKIYGGYENIRGYWAGIYLRRIHKDHIKWKFGIR